MKLNGNVTEMMKATGVEFSRRAPAPVERLACRSETTVRHHAQRPRRAEVAGDGKKVAIGPGHINLIEDTTGKGHTTRNIGPDDRIVVTIPLADQTVNTR